MVYYYIIIIDNKNKCDSICMYVILEPIFKDLLF